MGAIIFETERFVVMQFDFNQDTENFFRLNGDEEVMRFIRPVTTREESAVFLKKIIAEYETRPGTGRWAVLEKGTGNFVGSFAFIPVINTENMQLGYAFLKAYWGRGIATELLKAGVSYVFENTDLELVYGITEVPNTASQKVLLKAGFVFLEPYNENGKDLYSYICRRKSNG
jgi:[ribosomal protein S5]-alanine N-acetyltransferase